MKKKIISEPPIIEYGSFTFEESNYERGNKRWMATTLLRACHDQGLEPFEYPLACYDMSSKYFPLNNTDDFVWQMKRCMNSDYNIPIILDNFGNVCDGNHRICKAILEGKRTILAYRLQYMPEPDFIKDGTNE